MEGKGSDCTANALLEALPALNYLTAELILNGAPPRPFGLIGKTVLARSICVHRHGLRFMVCAKYSLPLALAFHYVTWKLYYACVCFVLGCKP